MAIQKKLYTIDEFEDFISLPENADRRFELINGEMVEDMPTQLHGHIVQLIAGYLFMYLLKNPIGWSIVEGRYQMPSDNENARVPDLSFVLFGEDRALVERGPAPYMPDLAVEVQSPGQDDQFMLDKALYYLANGTSMVWLVYPKLRLVEALTPTRRVLLTMDHALTGGNLLPEFEVLVRDIFPKE